MAGHRETSTEVPKINVKEAKKESAGSSSGNNVNLYKKEASSSSDVDPERHTSSSDPAEGPLPQEAAKPLVPITSMSEDGHRETSTEVPKINVEEAKMESAGSSSGNKFNPYKKEASSSSDVDPEHHTSSSDPAEGPLPQEAAKPLVPITSMPEDIKGEVPKPHEASSMSSSHLNPYSTGLQESVRRYKSRELLSRRASESFSSERPGGAHRRRPSDTVSVASGASGASGASDAGRKRQDAPAVYPQHAGIGGGGLPYGVIPNSQPFRYSLEAGNNRKGSQGVVSEFDQRSQVSIERESSRDGSNVMVSDTEQLGPAVRGNEGESSAIGATGEKGTKYKERETVERTELEYTTPVVLSSVARDLVAEQRIQEERGLIAMWKKPNNSGMFKEGRKSRSKVVEGFEAALEKYKDQPLDPDGQKISEELRTELIQIATETIGRLEQLTLKQGNTIKEVYNNPRISKEILGDEVIKRSATVLDKLDTMIETHSLSLEQDSQQEGSGSSLLNNLNRLRDYVRGCEQVGKDSFSNIVGMKRTIQDDRERLESFFNKFRSTALKIADYNKKTRMGLDFLTTAHASVTNSLTNFSLGDMTVSSRLKDTDLPVAKFAQFVPQIEGFYKNLSKEEAPSPEIAPLDPRPTQELKDYLTGDPPPPVVTENPKATGNLVKRIDKLHLPLTSKQYETIKSGLERYESGLLESSVERVISSASGASSYYKAYQSVLKDIDRVDKYLTDENILRGKDLREDVLNVFLEDQSHYAQKTQELITNIAKEVGSQKSACASALNLVNENTQLGNIESFRMALVSFGNIAQKFGTITVGAAAGHAVAGFPNA